MSYKFVSKLNNFIFEDRNALFCLTFSFVPGGFETTANALTFMCFLLAKNPDVQDKLYQEISENIEVIKTLSLKFLS